MPGRPGTPKSSVTILAMDPRPAATVMLPRVAEDGVEVLVLRRGAASRFAPGFVVFPGGVLEAADRALAERWFGDPEEAFRACALRELFEEAGILLTADGPRSATPDRPIESVAFEPAPAASLREIARWVAPEFLDVRFDARFYAAAMPGDLEPVADGEEIDRAWWANPGQVLASAEAGETRLMWPTMVMLRALAGCHTVEEVMRLDVPQIPRDPSVQLPRP
jgi:8-oxo-dGTP pyrophosphatase MutT (NUDIX family)